MGWQLVSGDIDLDETVHVKKLKLAAPIHHIVLVRRNRSLEVIVFSCAKSCVTTPSRKRSFSILAPFGIMSSN
jgi:hypothetical protein